MIGSMKWKSDIEGGLIAVTCTVCRNQKNGSNAAYCHGWAILLAK